MVAAHSASPGARVVLRPYRAEDAPAALGLVIAGLGPGRNFRRTPEFWRWKHLDNPFGASRIFLAVDPEAGDRVVGVRALLRWAFRVDGQRVEAGRAVDSVVERAYRRQGIFRRLVTASVDDARTAALDLLWNTPNERSYGVYRDASGWTLVGRPQLLVRPVDPVRTILRRIGRSAEDESLDGPYGWRERPEAVRAALDATSDLPGLIERARRLAGRGLVTARSATVLAWRYGSEATPAYAAVTAADREGLLVVRVRDRGRFRVAMLSEVLVSDVGPTLRHLVTRLARSVDADYAAASAAPGSALFRGLVRAGFVPLPRVVGLRLTCLALRPERVPVPVGRLSSWRLGLGDLALF